MYEKLANKIFIYLFQEAKGKKRKKEGIFFETKEKKELGHKTD